MMSDVEWTNLSVTRLIEEYKKRRELWDKDDDLYRAQTAKYEAWASMAKLFQCDIADLRKKLNSVFASYRREKAKIRAGGKTTWYFYHQLNFLSNHIDQPQILRRNHDEGDSQMEQDEISDDQDIDDYENQEDVIVKEEPVIEYVQAKSLPPLRTSGRLKRTVKRRVIREPTNTTSSHRTYNNTTSSHIDSKLLEMLRLLRKSSEKKKDECDSFGEYIAVSLRKHDERTQSMIKQAINNILFEQEMKKYNSSFVVITSNDENPLVLGEVETVTS